MVQFDQGREGGTPLLIVSPPGIHISLGICVWGYTYQGDTHITVTSEWNFVRLTFSMSRNGQLRWIFACFRAHRFRTHWVGSWLEWILQNQVSARRLELNNSYFSANHSDSTWPCCVQRDKYTKTDKRQRFEWLLQNMDQSLHRG